MPKNLTLFLDKIKPKILATLYYQHMYMSSKNLELKIIKNLFDSVTVLIQFKRYFEVCFRLWLVAHCSMSFSEHECCTGIERTEFECFVCRIECILVSKIKCLKSSIILNPLSKVVVAPRHMFPQVVQHIDFIPSPFFSTNCFKK